MATEAAPAPPEGGSIELLKRVKAVETEWDQKLVAARRESEETLQRLREEAAAAVRAASAAAEAERARALERARAEAEREGATILIEGERAAREAGREDGKRPEDRRERVLAVVLGPFLPE